jgi:hypothetical protein
MTQLEKLAARLKQLQNRAVTLLIITDKDGQPVAWVVQSEYKVEGCLLKPDEKQV